MVTCRMGKLAAFGRVLKDSFKILEIKNVRIYMFGQSISLVGDWMQQTAQAWLVWQLTHKATALGIVALLSQAPFFVFGPWVGSFADRYSRRSILLVTQVLAMVFAFALALLLQTHTLVLWHVYLLALLLGAVTAFNTTAEQAFIGDIAGPGKIQKAIALNNSINQLSRFIGPALAGWLIGGVGIVAAFWLNGLSVVVSVVCIVLIKPTEDDRVPPELSGWTSFRRGLAFIGHERLLRLILLLGAIQAFFGLSIVQLQPAIASTVLHGDANTLGSLVGAAGAGAFIGTVFVLPFLARLKKPCVSIGGAVIWAGCWYCLFSFSKSLQLSMLCQFMASLGAANVLTLSVGLAQELTPSNMRASIISTFMMMIFGLQPLASYLVGRAADLYGLHTTIFVNGLVMVLLSASMLMIPLLHRLKTPVSAPYFYR
jgi:MFS family permease